MGQPRTDYGFKPYGMVSELISAQSALNMEPEPVAEPTGDRFIDTDGWAAHAYEHLSAARVLLGTGPEDCGLDQPTWQAVLGHLQEARHSLESSEPDPREPEPEVTFAFLPDVEGRAFWAHRSMYEAVRLLADVVNRSGNAVRVV